MKLPPPIKQSPEIDAYMEAIGVEPPVRKNRIWVTSLDGYLAFRDNLYHEEELFDYVNHLVGSKPPSLRMGLGTYLHAALEVAGVKGGTMDHEIPGEFQIRCYEHIELARPSAVEVPVTKVYHVNGREVTLSGKLDAISGRRGVDYKTADKIDMERLADAFQWRCYLDMLPELDTFRYDVFQMKETRSGMWDIVRHVRLEQTRYIGLHEEVEALVAEYDRFLMDLERAGHIELDERGVIRVDRATRVR